MNIINRNIHTCKLVYYRTTHVIEIMSEVHYTAFGNLHLSAVGGVVP